MSDTTPCPICGQPVPKERIELLEIKTCKRCTPPEPPIFGTFDYPPDYHERNEGVGGLIVVRGQPNRKRG